MNSLMHATTGFMVDLARVTKAGLLVYTCCINHTLLFMRAKQHFTVLMSFWRNFQFARGQLHNHRFCYCMVSHY